MLGKLIKHEYKATSRNFWLLYLLFLLITVFNKIFLEINISNNQFLRLFQDIFMFTYIIMCMSLFILTLVFLVMRFYKNMLGDEGYLMFTLPVKTWQHLVSKLILCTLWCFLSVICFVISIFILVSGHGELTLMFKEILAFWDYVILSFGNRIYFTISLYLVLFFLSHIFSWLMTYLSLGIGQLFNQHKILASIGAYFILYTLIQIVTGTVLSINFSPQDMIDNNTFVEEIFRSLNSFALISIALTAIGNVVLFLSATSILDKKLNLE